MKDLIIKKSKIEGKGVFAQRDFKKGEVIIRWDVSHKLTPDEIKKLSKEESKYVSHINGRYILMQAPAKYVNHSCDANTYVKNFCDVAKRDITRKKLKLVL